MYQLWGDSFDAYIKCCNVGKKLMSIMEDDAKDITGNKNFQLYRVTIILNLHKIDDIIFYS